MVKIILAPMTKKDFRVMHNSKVLEILTVTKFTAKDTVSKLEQLTIDRLKTCKGILTSHVDTSNGDGVTHTIYSCELEGIVLYFVETLYLKENLKFCIVYRRKL